jgi:hypothetical protein
MTAMLVCLVSVAIGLDCFTADSSVRAAVIVQHKTHIYRLFAVLD